MRLDEMQKKILVKLKEIFPEPQFEVEPFPDDPAGYQFMHNNAAILLVFKDRQFDRPRDSEGTLQGNEPVFQIAFLTHSLLGDSDYSGAYELLDDAKGGLAGFMIENNFLWIKREYFQRMRSGGVWQFGQDWTLDNEADYHDL